MSKKYAEISKFLSYILRHEPQSVGLNLDIEGWANINDLITCANQSGKEIGLEQIQQVVETSDKKRFVISADGLSIRAVQGHSTKSVSINYDEKTPPEFLYHGTATRFLDSIYKEGLLSGSRQYVHLSQDELTALTVGQRHGKPVALKIKALLMHEQGFKFFQADNNVWLTNTVASKFILQPD
ncbi:MAG TPA: RNA 2'-phosphotransferase [Methylotenera sp.]|nr:RNA 2'-phosphotransferase [Methylotenera sp.]HPN02242.1 RNA 2'-phosphotransferase [Methylotenera sp.]